MPILVCACRPYEPSRLKEIRNLMEPTFKALAAPDSDEEKESDALSDSELEVCMACGLMGWFGGTAHEATCPGPPTLPSSRVAASSLGCGKKTGEACR